MDRRPEIGNGNLLVRRVFFLPLILSSTAIAKNSKEHQSVFQRYKRFESLEYFIYI